MNSICICYVIYLSGPILTKNGFLFEIKTQKYECKTVKEVLGYTDSEEPTECNQTSLSKSVKSNDTRFACLYPYAQLFIAQFCKRHETASTD